MAYKHKTAEPRRLDVPAIVTKFGSPEMIALALKQEGLAKIEPVAVTRWLDRGLIPSERLVALMILARRNRMKFDPVDYWVG